MKKIFGGINLTWKKLIIYAIVIGISVGLLNSVPSLYDTTITDIATYFDFWIFCGIFIIMNSKSNTTTQNLMKVMIPNEFGITEIQLDWENIYGKLSKGTYRIIKKKNSITLYSEQFNIE